MGNRWTPELFRRELLTICERLGRFPTNSELRAHGRNDISCQIVKRGGYVKWASELGFPRANSDSDFGWRGEGEVVSILTGKGFDVETRNGVRCPYDLIVNKYVRVDVKTANYAAYGNKQSGGSCTGWFFRLGKDVQSDIVILYQADTGNLHVLPWFRCTSSNITITKTGKTYAAFLNNFDLLRDIAIRRESEAKSIQSEAA